MYIFPKKRKNLLFYSAFLTFGFVRPADREPHVQLDPLHVLPDELFMEQELHLVLLDLVDMALVGHLSKNIRSRKMKPKKYKQIEDKKRQEKRVKKDHLTQLHTDLISFHDTGSVLLQARDMQLKEPLARQLSHTDPSAPPYM